MERSFLLQRGKIDLETGRFPLTLFTNGEASDGHIVDIRGLEVPEHMTMFANHYPSPVERMGGLIEPHKVGKQTRLGGGSLKMTGVIDMQGDGMWPDIRRDVAHGISVGDVKAMSGSWDPIESTPRASLPKNHYAYSDVEGGWSTPMFYSKSKALEGSIVGLGADTAALAGRSQDLHKPQHVREFWDVLVNGDPISRDRALEALYVDAAQVEGWEEIECEDGKVFVPAGVARVWGQSLPEDEELLSEAEAETDTDMRLAAWLRDRKPLPLSYAQAEEQIAVLDRFSAETRKRNESTEPEPVSVPESEATETAEPVSVPAVAATERANVALPDIPDMEAMAREIDSEITAWLSGEMGFIQ